MLSPCELIINALTSLGKKVKAEGTGKWRAQCPCHEDRQASLSIGTGDDGRALVHDQAGCPVEQVVAALGLKMCDLMPQRNGHHHTNGAAEKPRRTWAELGLAVAAMTPAGYSLTDTYLYKNASGEVYAVAVRFDNATGKTVRPFARSADGWFCGDPQRWLPYRINEALQHEVIFVEEGEKCADAAWMIGLASVTSAHGAKSAAKTDWTALRGKNIVIIPDADPAGEAYSADVAAILHGLGCKVKIVRLPGLPAGGDIVDWQLAMPDSISPEQLRDDILQMAELAPFWEPPVKEQTAPGAPAGDANKKQDRPCTDLGNAERLIDQHGDDLRYCPGIGWLAFCGTHWERDSNGEVYRKAAKTVRSINNEAANCGDDTLRKALQRLAATSESERAINAMISLAKSDIRIAIMAEQLDCNPMLLNVRNGTVNLATGELLPHRREDLITRTAPVNFDADAKCPIFDTFMARILPGESTREFVMRLFGYALTGMIHDQVFPVFYGSGQNGKSTLLDLIAEILGNYAGVAPDSLLVVRHNQEHPTELASLMGLRLVTASETEAGAKLRVQLIKKLTGDARIKARKMRQDFFEFNRTHKCILATNHKPEIHENTVAIWRRIRLVPFSVAIPKAEQDTHLHERLMAEASGILNRLIAACLAWQRDGLAEPPEVLAATEAYRTESEPLKAWLDDRCIIEPLSWVKSSVLWKSYTNFCEAIKEKPLTNKAFSAALTEHGFKPERTKAARGWTGLGLNADEEIFNGIGDG